MLQVGTRRDGDGGREKMEWIVGSKRRGKGGPERGLPRYPSGEDSMWTARWLCGKYEIVLHHLLNIICIQNHLIVRLFAFREGSVLMHPSWGGHMKIITSPVPLSQGCKDQMSYLWRIWPRDRVICIINNIIQHVKKSQTYQFWNLLSKSPEN